MKRYIITRACCAAFHRCGLDASWDGELCLWPDETRPLSTYLWISRSRDSVSTTCLLPAGRPLSPLQKRGKHFSHSRARRLALAYTLLPPKFALLLDPPKQADWRAATGASPLPKETAGVGALSRASSPGQTPGSSRAPPHRGLQPRAAHSRRHSFRIGGDSRSQKRDEGDNRAT